MDPALAVSFVAVLVMALAIVYIGQLDFLSRSPRNWVLSLCGGAAVGYGFVGLLPKLTSGHEKLAPKLEKAVPLLEQHVFLVALAGMLTYYGLVLASYASHRRRREEEDKDTGSPVLLWANIALFSLYVFVLGEFVETSAVQGVGAVLARGGVLALHFAATDFGLRNHFRDRWVARTRWVMGGSVVAGWLTGALLHPPETLIALATAFMVGAILVNTLSDELPSERSARFLPFLAGAAGSGLLFATIG